MGYPPIHGVRTHPIIAPVRQQCQNFFTSIRSRTSSPTGVQRSVRRYAQKYARHGVTRGNSARQSTLLFQLLAAQGGFGQIADLDSKSRALHWACGFDPHLQHQFVSIRYRPVSRWKKWWAVTGSNHRPPACKESGTAPYLLSVPRTFNNLGRLLSLSRHLLRAQYQRY
jgi:hypothetical protein